MARALNLARRQLDREQKRQIIADQLHETPERSVRWIGKMLGVEQEYRRLRPGRTPVRLSNCQPDDNRRPGWQMLFRISPAVNHERYTPSALIDAVRQVFGEIDLDPASSNEANKVVQAKSFFTKRTNGLKKRWRGRVFLNPPFDDWPSWMAKLDRGDQSRPREAGHCRWPSEHRRLSALVQAKRPVVHSR